MTRLWWVRHGPTHAREMIGWTDRAADLSDHAAVARLRDHLPEAPVVSSDLSRAMQTAAAIGRGRPLPPLPALRETQFGDWAGLRFAQAEARDPALIRRIGAATAAETAATGIDWSFAPTVAVVQDDRWGRTYESYSEEPEIVQAYAGQMVEGLQGTVGQDFMASAAYAFRL